MLTVIQDPYILMLEDGRLPSLLNLYAKSAKLYEEIDHKSTNPGDWCFVAIAHPQDLPFLALSIRYSPAGGGFNPGILLVPETQTLFIGAGQRLLAYDLATPKQLWQDKVDAGFWGWARHNDVIIASAELEIAAWSHDGKKKLWSHFAEPPWTYHIRGRTLSVKADSFQTSFDLYNGR